MSEEPEILNNSYVELLPDREQVYAENVIAHSRGWVRNMRLDDEGYKKVFIEWDKNHWRYNDQADGWAYASHFKVVPAPEEERDLIQNDGEICTNCGEVHRYSVSDMENYIDQIGEGLDQAAGSEGFFMITIQSRQDPVHGEVMVVEGLRGAINPDIAQLDDLEIIKFVWDQIRDSRDQ